MSFHRKEGAEGEQGEGGCMGALRRVARALSFFFWSLTLQLGVKRVRCASCWPRVPLCEYLGLHVYHTRLLALARTLGTSGLPIRGAPGPSGGHWVCPATRQPGTNAGGEPRALGHAREDEAPSWWRAPRYRADRCLGARATALEHQGTLSPTLVGNGTTGT